MIAVQTREFELSDQDFEFIRSLVTGRTGIVLSAQKRELVYGRVVRRLRHLGLNSFSDYCALLQQTPDVEVPELVNAVTTNLTSFFREQHHFDYLQNDLLPKLLKQKAATRRLRIWSAGCSTGEEPYSIAMVVRELIPPGSGWDAKILATDIDTEVLARASEGVYARDRIDGLPAARARRWFLHGSGGQSGKVRVKDELKSLIAFRQLNLMDAWPMHGPMDIIFCRNVVIYFDKSTQAKLFDRFANLLGSGNHLFVGHSESLHNVCNRFQSLGHTVYARI